ncbi:hypothetical protein E4T43_00781 [Aureobasidium subglaciale]|nr:hypothetical protein E4T43_00781 [Aureobasidium subglaciale]
MLYLHSRMWFDSNETGCRTGCAGLTPVIWIGFTILWICLKAHLTQPGFRRTKRDKTALFRRVQAVKDALPTPKHKKLHQTKLCRL